MALIMTKEVTKELYMAHVLQDTLNDTWLVRHFFKSEHQTWADESCDNLDDAIELAMTWTGL